MAYEPSHAAVESNGPRTLLAAMHGMTHISLSRALSGTVAFAAVFVAGACGDSRKQHAVDGDTGAASPAMTRDMSATPMAPDSTKGVAHSTGGGAPAGTTDSTKKPPIPTTPPSARR